jgi:hypothetical protein
VVNITPRLLYPRERTRFPLNRGLFLYVSSQITVSVVIFLKLMGNQCRLRNEFKNPSVFRNTRMYSSVVSGNMYGAQIGVPSKCSKVCSKRVHSSRYGTEPAEDGKAQKSRQVISKFSRGLNIVLHSGSEVSTHVSKWASGGALHAEQIPCSQCLRVRHQVT